MRITLELDEAKVEELMRLLGVGSEVEAIHLAIDGCLRSARRSRIRTLSGRMAVAEDWRRLRDRDK